MDRLRLALGLALAGVVGLVLPGVVAGVDSPSVVIVASLAAAVAAMVQIGSGRVLVPAFALVRVRADEHVTATLPGRVTDPCHHPIRRRAPGQV